MNKEIFQRDNKTIEEVYPNWRTSIVEEMNHHKKKSLVQLEFLFISSTDNSNLAMYGSVWAGFANRSERLKEENSDVETPKDSGMNGRRGR